jgi:hypothetical protein
LLYGTAAAHSAHATHTAAHAAASGSVFFFFGFFGDEAFGRQHQTGDTGRVLQCGACYLGRIDDACREKVFVFA